MQHQTYNNVSEPLVCDYKNAVINRWGNQCLTLLNFCQTKGWKPRFAQKSSGCAAKKLHMFPTTRCSSLQQRVSVARKVAIPLNNTDTVGFTLSNSRQNGTEKSGIVAKYMTTQTIACNNIICCNI